MISPKIIALTTIATSERSLWTSVAREFLAGFSGTFSFVDEDPAAGFSGVLAGPSGNLETGLGDSVTKGLGVSVTKGLGGSGFGDSVKLGLGAATG